MATFKLHSLCAEVTVRSKGNSFTFLKTTDNCPKGGRILFGFFVLEEVAEGPWCQDTVAGLLNGFVSVWSVLVVCV